MFAIAPITAAVAAICGRLLNIIEKPNTPQKLANNRRQVNIAGSIFNLGIDPGCKRKTVATAQPAIVAITIIKIA